MELLLRQQGQQHAEVMELQGRQHAEVIQQHAEVMGAFEKQHELLSSVFVDTQAISAGANVLVLQMSSISKANMLKLLESLDVLLGVRYYEIDRGAPAAFLAANWRDDRGPKPKWYQERAMYEKVENVVNSWLSLAGLPLRTVALEAKLAVSSPAVIVQGKTDMITLQTRAATQADVSRRLPVSLLEIKSPVTVGQHESVHQAVTQSMALAVAHENAVVALTDAATITFVVTSETHFGRDRTGMPFSRLHVTLHVLGAAALGRAETAAAAPVQVAAAPRLRRGSAPSATSAGAAAADPGFHVRLSCEGIDVDMEEVYGAVAIHSTAPHADQVSLLLHCMKSHSLLGAPSALRETASAGGGAGGGGHGPAGDGGSAGDSAVGGSGGRREGASRPRASSHSDGVGGTFSSAMRGGLGLGGGRPPRARRDDAGGGCEMACDLLAEDSGGGTTLLGSLQLGLSVLGVSDTTGTHVSGEPLGGKCKYGVPPNQIVVAGADVAVTPSRAHSAVTSGGTDAACISSTYASPEEDDLAGGIEVVPVGTSPKGAAAPSTAVSLIDSHVVGEDAVALGAGDGVRAVNADDYVFLAAPLNRLLTKSGLGWSWQRPLDGMRVLLQPCTAPM